MASEAQSQIEELMPLVIGKGTNMRLFIDHSQPEDSLGYNWVETTYDGKDDSDVLAVPSHWHQNHDEIMEVLSGRMIFYLDGKELVTSAGDPPLLIARGHVHGFTVIKGETVTFTERTKPTGTFKALFFQDMFATSSSPSIGRVFRAFYDWDTYVSLPGGFKTVDYVFMTVAGYIAGCFVSAKPKGLKRKGDQVTVEPVGKRGGFFSK